MGAFSVENPHDGKMFENYTRFEWGVEVGVVTIFMLRLFVPREFDMPTEKKLTDHRHGPTLSIFVFRKMRSEEHFVFFLVYEETTLKVTTEFLLIFLLFGRKSAGSFCRTISGTRAHETSRCDISTTLFVHAVQPSQPRVES